MRLFNSAREYHEKTKYVFDDVKSVYSEFSSEPQPQTINNYPGKPVTNLPRNFNQNVANLKEAEHQIRSITGFRRLREDAIDLQVLSQLLYMSNGVTRVRDFPTQRVFLRAAPSASGLYPVEIYVLANQVSGLRQGLYYFNPHQHHLVKLRNGEPSVVRRACFDLSVIEPAPVILFLSSNFSRSSWRYKDRAYRYCLLDAGYLLGNMILAACSLELITNLVGDFVDDEINRYLGIDGLEEAALLAAPIGKDAGAAGKEKYTYGMLKPEADFIDEQFQSLVHGIHHNSSHYHPNENMLNVDISLPLKKTPEVRKNLPEQIDLPESQSGIAKSVFTIIENRRSSHNFLRTPLTLKELSVLLSGLGRVPSLYNFPAYNIYVVLNNVEGLANGLYRYDRQNHRLGVIKEGTFRGDMSYLTLAQDAVFNCSAAFFFSVDFEEIDVFSNRGYRYAHLNIGMLSESLYLTAAALDLGVRGIGNFFDDSINTFLKAREPYENILGGVIVGRS